MAVLGQKPRFWQIQCLLCHPLQHSIKKPKPGLVAHTFSRILIQETKAGPSLWIQGQPGTQNKTPISTNKAKPSSSYARQNNQLSQSSPVGKPSFWTTGLEPSDHFLWPSAYQVLKLDGSVVKRTYCSYKGPEFSSLNLLTVSSSQLPITPTPKPLMPFSGFWQHVRSCSYSNVSHTHTRDREREWIKK